jgi:hypothetical protein
MSGAPVREPRVVSGVITASRLFDVGDAVDLARAETIWREQPQAASMRRRLITAPPKAIAFEVPPLDIPLETRTVSLDGVGVSAEVMLRLYDFGVARLALNFRADDMPWSDYVRRMNAVDRILGPAASNGLWGELLEQVQSRLAGAVQRPNRSRIEEDYLTGTVRAFDEPMSGEQLQQRLDLAPLLAGEDRPLSEAARRDLLRQRFSYYTDDLVVMTWDRAFIYEPRGDADVADVLEVANAQLIEMRYYDRMLDGELPRMYDLVEAMQRSGPWLGSRRFANLARRLYALVAEVTELREKVDNSLRVSADVYLARIYAAALETFRVAQLNAAVDRKLALIRDTYSALYEEASARRATLMEAAIIALIAVELMLALLRI